MLLYAKNINKPRLGERDRDLERERPMKKYQRHFTAEPKY